MRCCSSFLKKNKSLLDQETEASKKNRRLFFLSKTVIEKKFGKTSQNLNLLKVSRGYNILTIRKFEISLRGSLIAFHKANGLLK